MSALLYASDSEPGLPDVSARGTQV